MCTSLSYGVDTISRLLKIIGLFCKRALQKRRYSAKETYNSKEPTNRSHPMIDLVYILLHEFVFSNTTHIPHAHTNTYALLKRKHTCANYTFTHTPVADLLMEAHWCVRVCVHV